MNTITNAVPSAVEAVDEKIRDSSSVDSPKELAYEEEGIAAPVDIPWMKKAPLLLAILFLTLGSNFASASLAPMKSTIKEELRVNNAKYGVISSASSLINTVFPILSGIAIDYWGPEWGSIFASTFIFLGSLFTSLGASVHSFPLMVFGQVVLGFGDTTIETAQSKLYTHFFFGDHLGFIYGLDIAIGRVFGLIARIVTVPIYLASSWVWAFWVPTILCAATLVLNIVYVLCAWKITGARVPTGRALAIARRNDDASSIISWRSEIKFIAASMLAVPASFWLIVVTQTLQAGTVGAYTSNQAEMIQITRNKSKAAAGYTSSLSAVIPIVLTPLLGSAFDRWGRRMYWVTWTASLWVLVFCLMGFTKVNPLAPAILASFALTTNALPFIASIPILVSSQANIGTAFGIWKAMNSSGSVIVEVAAGAIQDQAKKDINQYRNVLLFLIALKGIDIIYGLLYDLIDRRWFGGVLRLSEKGRAKQDEVQTDEEKMSALRGPVRAMTAFGLLVLVSTVVTAWVLFLKYSIA